MGVCVVVAVGVRLEVSVNVADSVGVSVGVDDASVGGIGVGVLDGGGVTDATVTGASVSMSVSASSVEATSRLHADTITQIRSVMTNQQPYSVLRFIFPSINFASKS